MADIAPAPTQASRSSSVSRGRDAAAAPGARDPSRGRDLISTGRGGAGNIVRSPSRDVEPESKGHVNSADVASRALSTGRGGAGNIRSPSRDESRGRYDAHTAALLADADSLHKANGLNGLDKNSVEYEREVLARHKEAEARKGVQSTGRGGAGNMTSASPNRSTSRSRSRAPPAVHSTGRGGAGNLLNGGASDAALEQLDEHERLGRTRDAGLHSTGRGGLGNVTPAAAPTPGADLEGHAHLHAGDHLESSGRGGAGNILHSRDASREGRSRDGSREPKDGARAGSRERLGQLWNNLKHHGHGHHHVEDPEAIQEVAGENEVAA